MTVPVHCKCGWTGFRIPAKIKARPCPACDGEVKRWRKLEVQVAIRTEIAAPLPLLPLEQAIEDREKPWREPVPALPVPYILRTMTGEVQIFRIPAHLGRRTPRRGVRR